MQELKEYWDEAYSSSNTRVAYVSAEGEDVTELEARATRNNFLFNDFITHCQQRPAPGMNKLFMNAQSCVEVGCGTGEFLVGLMSITGIADGIGIDLSQSAIKHASLTYGNMVFSRSGGPGQEKYVKWHAGDMMSLDITNRADVLIANQVIEHFRDPTPIIRQLQEYAQYVIILTPYKEQIPNWDDEILDGSDNHLISVDENTYSEFEVLEDMVFFSKEGWGVSRKGECPLQYAVLIKGTTPPLSWGTFR